MRGRIHSNGITVDAQSMAQKISWTYLNYLAIWSLLKVDDSMSTGLEDPGDQHPTHTSSSEDEDQGDWDVLETPFKTMDVDISSD